MNAVRLMAYVTGLVVLAFALGSLPRGSPSGSLLFQSTWLLYLVYLGPIIVLGLMVAAIVVLAYSWREVGRAIGFKMAQKRRNRKRSRYTLFIWLLLWAVAVGVLINRPGSIFNPLHTNSTFVNDIRGENPTASNPFTGFILPIVASFVQNDWFSVAAIGLLAFGGLILVQSIRSSLQETADMTERKREARQIEGLQATEGAIKLVDDTLSDPRTRIIRCFQYMITAASRMGAPVFSDQTARELDGAIRSAFALKGSATTELTQLFEEARYSLHDISNDDANHARKYLESIADELRFEIVN